MEGWGGIGGEHKVLASYKAKAATEEGRDVSASEGKEEEEERAAASLFLKSHKRSLAAHFLRLCGTLSCKCAVRREKGVWLAFCCF